jgi:hypothetical protein
MLLIKERGRRECKGVKLVNIGRAMDKHAACKSARPSLGLPIPLGHHSTV